MNAYFLEGNEFGLQTYRDGPTMTISEIVAELRCYEWGTWRDAMAYARGVLLGQQGVDATEADDDADDWVIAAREIAQLRSWHHQRVL